MKKIKIFFILIFFAALIGAGVFFVFRNKTQITYTTEVVKKGNVVQTVSETGTVKASKEINLNFLNTGRIKKINVKVGDNVVAGQVLSELDYDNLSINKNEAIANLSVAQNDLNKLLAGATNEEIAVARANTQQAKAAYDAAKNELEKIKKLVADNIAQAYKTLSDLESNTSNDVTTYEQAITVAQTNLNNSKLTYQRSIDNYKNAALNTIDSELAKANNALDVVDTTINDQDGKDMISLRNEIYLENTKSTYREGLSLITNANNSFALIDVQKNDTIFKALDDSLLALNKVFGCLQYCYSALENSVTSSSFTQSELDTLKLNIRTQQSNISPSISSVQTAKHNLDNAILSYDTNISGLNDALNQAKVAYDNAVKNAKNALSTASLNGEQQTTASQSKLDATLEAWQVSQAQLNKIVAPANKYDISLAEARIRQAQAAVDSITNQIENSLIKSPINGTITKVDYEIGEQASPGGKPVISVLGENNFEIEVLISEADIAKINKDDKVEITLDAFGDDVKFAGKVFSIDPAETIIQDVIYYKVIVVFDAAKENIKSGMTANTIITTAEKDGVLIIPNRAIIEKDGVRYARVLVDNKVEEKTVSLGLRGDEGMIEVLSGLNGGETVVTYIKEK